MKRWWKAYYTTNRARMGHLTLSMIVTDFNIFVRRSSKAGGGRVSGRANKHVVRKWYQKSVDEDPLIKEKLKVPEE